MVDTHFKAAQRNILNTGFRKQYPLYAQAARLNLFDGVQCGNVARLQRANHQVPCSIIKRSKQFRFRFYTPVNRVLETRIQLLLDSGSDALFTDKQQVDGRGQG